MRIDYKLNDRFDLSIFIPLVILVLMGLAAIYSSTINHPVVGGNFFKQTLWVLISFVTFFIIYFLPTNLFRLLALPSFAISIFLLLLVLVIGKEISGSKSWISFGTVGFQPAEVAKIGTILMLAEWLSRAKGEINNLKDISIAMTIGFVPVLLILAENETGVAIVFVVLVLGMLFWAGLSLFSLFVVLMPGIVVFASMFGDIPFFISVLVVLVLLIYFRRDIFTSAAIFIGNLAAGFFFDYAFKLLKPHQQLRIRTFLNPDADPLGAGYNIIQAKVAIGSGGILGKGFLQGNQTKYGFIPEQWTDFIYCVIGEEFGFIGSVLIIVLFLIILARLLNIGLQAKDNFSSLIIIGVMMTLTIHFIINVGMNLGIMPVIGLPLPFVSYGGTSLLNNMILIGLAMNIYRHRKIQT